MILDRFKRVNQSVNAELIGDDEVVTFEDLVLDDETGKPKKRGGWARFNSNQVNASGTIRDLHDVISSAGTNYLIAGINGTLRKSSDGTGTWSEITTKGTPPYRMEAYADSLIFTDGLVSPFIVSGATFGDVTDLEISPMNVSSVNTGHQTGGSLEANAQYKWIFCYVTAEGELSPPSQPITHRISLGTVSTTDASIKQVGFQNLPASTDTRVVGIRIFRTLKDSEIYYYHSQIDNVDTDWLDNKADSYLGSEGFNYVNCPSSSKYITLHKERIWHGYISRNVKNFVEPAKSETAVGAFSAAVGGYTTSVDPGYGWTLIAGTSGTLSAGTYQYRVVFVDSEGLESDPYDSPALAISGAEDSIILAEIPYLMGNDSIVRADIYRTSNGGTNWYKVADYDPNYPFTFGARDSYEDIGWADGTEYATNVVSETTKTGVAFSEIGQPANYPLENLRNIFPDDGDEITGIFDDIDGLLIFKKNSICKIFTSGSPVNWRLVKILENIGSNEPYSIAKYGTDYYFVHYDKIYKFGSGGYQDIGEQIKDTLTGTIYYWSSTVSKRWYVLGIGGAAAPLGQYYLIFDLMLQTWYKFNFPVIPYTAIIKEHGTSTGKILVSNADYVLYYGTGSVDTLTGSNVDIVPTLQTKTFKFPDGISLARLRKVKFNYKKLDDETLTITITNPDTAVTNTYADTTNATNTSDFKTYEPTMASDSLTVTPKLYIKFTGAGLTEFSSFRLELKPINRGEASV